jgi:hypothetical protein
MWLAGVIVACIGGYIVVAVRQDNHAGRRRLPEILGYVMILIGIGLFVAGR